MASSEPRALGRFQLIEPIATGTTATIWRAHDPKRRQDVVIKHFHPHVVADETGARRLESEAANARRLSHEGIVRPIDRYAADGDLALVFPYVAGRSLAAVLADGPLPTERAAAVATDVAAALAFAHSRGIVHRDVKPGNILVGDDGRARLLDFGISQSVAEAEAIGAGLTGAGLVVGSLPYMSPEQLRGEQATPASDVFSLGVVLYEMLCGHRPYNPSNPVEMAEAQKMPPARIADAPASLMDLAAGALALNASERPTAAAFAVTARTWNATPEATDAPTVAIPVAPATVAAKPRRALAFAAPLAALLVLALVALAAVPALNIGTSGTPESAAPAVATSQPSEAPAEDAPAIEPAAQNPPTNAPAPGQNSGGGDRRGDGSGGRVNRGGQGNGNKNDKPDKKDKKGGKGHR